ncbi:helix-turn-helix protein [Sediminihabitans luteus]|uniref:Helix-turn-helix protein n=1 Tax=Sediminihabitans luteus TaxID=1138585 RepID=A0A2M9D0E0_9CELL|nr:DUF2637 domain-containing protein [Sediminihabitans luteus]PJJ77478.1 helix-turn-helix protein [Sediminihabitans luteus]GII98374.1 hypothetical protein Slu03_07520 [Sediminihabitans luteus]
MSTPARINPDTTAALLVAVLATSGLVGISFVLSFAGLSALAPWVAVEPHLAWLLPLFIDGAILVYTYSALAARARHESAARPWTWVALWTAVSSAANGAHALEYGTHDTTVALVVGVALAALIPVGSLLGTHEIADRMIARPTTPDALDVEYAQLCDHHEAGRDTFGIPAGLLCTTTPVGLGRLATARQASHPALPDGTPHGTPTEPAAGHDDTPTASPRRRRLTTRQRNRIHTLARDGMSVRGIADKVGVSASTVSRHLTQQED